MKEKRYLYRGFHPDENGKTTITLNGEKISGEWYYWDYKGVVQYPKIPEETRWYQIGVFDIIPETVGQWVKEDKNGKDVFDGDKLKDMCGVVYTVCYNRLKWQVREDLEKFYAHIDLGCFSQSEFELIGSKWEVTE